MAQNGDGERGVGIISIADVALMPIMIDDQPPSRRRPSSAKHMTASLIPPIL